jgi:hypothetical protein
MKANLRNPTVLEEKDKLSLEHGSKLQPPYKRRRGSISVVVQACLTDMF